jgi:GntR family transcriptional regulator
MIIRVLGLSDLCSYTPGMVEDVKKSGVEIRRESGLPVYLQLVDQLRYLIGAGRFRTGEYLPATRELAGELGVNFNTVNRAYRQLQRDGIIRSTPGKGAVVVRATRSAEGMRSPLGAVTFAPSHDEIDAILLAALERALAAGVEADEIGARVASLLESLARRVPPKIVVVLESGRPWRDLELVGRLATASGRSVVPATFESADERRGDDLADVRRAVVLPRFGGWVPVARVDYFRTVEVPVHLSRESVQRLLLVEPGARIVVIAADAPVTRWLAEVATSLLATPSAIREVTVEALEDKTVNDSEFAIVEAGMPGSDALASKERALVVDLAFAPTARDLVAQMLEATERVEIAARRGDRT